ncbi:peptide methionine sulfoxide reductase MsrA [Saccharopolyspora subtropica]|uniref:Peptide methionine sulfoxide reductase MsrA n=1 Tax=Saccharopolyspora thermophila TaxID=89367 RepID=A0A917JR32_9PSEU|nr:peptide-methionine (S)-S-oxide reductase MsrA [Saccharopolyspora subtropica]GGI82148.1 peptide methionine sulfoxide reductase MsrA [Saccharopolyspora subtropica]
MALFGDKTRLIDASEALPGRDTPMPVAERHTVFPDRRIVPPFPDGLATAVVGMGCFWGAERAFWRTDGVWSTAVGYAGGFTPNPTYEEVCTGRTGHAEVVLVVFDPTRITYQQVLKVFWENHDPTQGMRQGNDIGTQYRSAIYYQNENERVEAEASREAFQRALHAAGHGQITTEIAPLKSFYYAETYHQQYLSDAKNPNGYCRLSGTGVTCPIGLNVTPGEQS